MGDEDPRPLSDGIWASLERIEQRIQQVPAAHPPPGEEGLPALPVEDQPRSGIGQELAFTPRLFAQLALPYRDPGPVPEWIRRNGGRELIVTPGRVLDPATGSSRAGYPYGVVPRLVVTWLAGEVLKHHQREISLGPSLGGFLARMGLTRSGTQAARVRDQITRLFASTVTVTATARNGPVTGWAMESVRVAHRARLWWHDDSASDPLWVSTVTLSQEFFQTVEEWSIPLDADALAALRSATRSPMALDIYAWLADRLWRVEGGRTPPIRWCDLAAQFGGDYKQVRQFKAQFVYDLKHVLAVYPKARVQPGPKGLVLRHSPPPISPKALSTCR